MAHGLLLDHLLDLFHREADDAPPDLNGLRAVRFQFYVFLLGQDERAELRKIVFQLKLALDRIKLYQSVAP